MIDLGCRLIRHWVELVGAIRREYVGKFHMLVVESC